jgi:hypothetical protein
MIELFIKECLLFRSNEIPNKVLGVVAWLSIAMLIYALVMLALLSFTKFSFVP